MKRAAVVLTILSGLAALAPAADRSAPPAPGAPRPVKLPEIQRRALSNGLAVRIVELRELPTVQISLILGSGAAADPKARPGVALMTADMLDEGAGTRDALALADALDAIGAVLSTGASWDSSSVSLHVPVSRLAEALPLMTDVALRPTFPAAELERLRKEALTGLLQMRDDPGDLARAALARAVFGDHRYGTLAEGDGRSIAALSVDDLRRYHAEHYRPGNATLIVVGDVPANVLEILERAFGSWPAGGQRPALLPPPAPPRERVFWLIDRSDAPQTALRLGQVGPDRRTPLYHPLEVMNTLLGGLFTSRLNDNLRETHGYAYGAGSSIAYRRLAGSFVAAANVQTPSTAPALTEMLKEVERIRTPATADEIARARSYLAMSYPESFETPGQIAGQIAEQVIYDLPDDVFASYVPRVMAVDVEAAQRAAAATLDPKRMVILAVGDRRQVEAPLRALNLGTLKVLTPDAVLGPPPKLE